MPSSTPMVLNSNGTPPAVAHALFDDFAEVLQVDVAWNQVDIRVADTDERPIEIRLTFDRAGRAQQAAVRCFGKAFGDGIAAASRSVGCRSREHRAVEVVVNLVRVWMLQVDRLVRKGRGRGAPRGRPRNAASHSGWFRSVCGAWRTCEARVNDQKMGVLFGCAQPLSIKEKIERKRFAFQIVIYPSRIVRITSTDCHNRLIFNGDSICEIVQSATT